MEIFYFRREILKHFRGNVNRHNNRDMADFIKTVDLEIKKGTRSEIPGMDPKKTVILDYARAHGYAFHYDYKYFKEVSAAITRPQVYYKSNVPHDDDSD